MKWGPAGMVRSVRFNAASLGLAVRDWRMRRVPYVGLANNRNLGDEELFRLAERAVAPKALYADVLERGHLSALALRGSAGSFVVGGGSLLLSNDWRVLDAWERLARAGGRACLLGTGSRPIPDDPALRERWIRLLKSTAVWAVRGPVTVLRLAELGFEAEPVGDMAYLANLDLDAPSPSNGYVVANVRTRNGPALEAQDGRTREVFTAVVDSLLAEGLEVVALSVDADYDHVVVREWADRWNGRVRVVLYEGKFDPIAQLLGGARAMVSMRMHAGLFAAAYGVPVALVDEREKYEDAIDPVRDHVTLFKPDGIDAEGLSEWVLSAAAEREVDRVARFNGIRAVASSQAKFCDDLRVRLVSP